MTDRRAAIYARYSTENQNDRSIDDQIALCEEYAARNGYAIAGRYSDAARSGGSMLGRDGLMDLLAAAGRKEFSAVIVEALDRLSRDMEDLAGLHKRLRFAGIELIAVHEGKASTVLVGLRGLVGQLFREDGAEKVRRGLSGVLRSGRSPGGRAYGYRPVQGRAGELAIVEDEAAVIRRIFSEYAEGRSPRDIAAQLNRDGIAPPRGARWNASTINGNATRGYGILLNALYRGELVWNRVTMIRDPDTGRRVSRVNPDSAWQRKEVPALRIVPPDLADAVLARKTGRSQPGTPRVRSKRLLSGLLRCGLCGGPMTMDSSSGGRPRIGCSVARESGTCRSKQRPFIEPIEQTVIAGLRQQLSDPAAMARYVETFNAQRNRDADRVTRERTKAERRLAEVKREINRIVDAIAAGTISHDDVKDRMAPLREERAQLERAVSRAIDETKVVALHPRAIEAHQYALDKLASVLASAVETNEKARNAFRAIVHSVVVTERGRYEPPLVEVRGILSALVGAEPPADVALKVVAGERSDRKSHIPHVGGNVVSIGAWIGLVAA